MPTIRTNAPPVTMAKNAPAMPLGVFVRHLRERDGLTTRQLAIRCGTTQRRILNIEGEKRNNDINVTTLCRFASAFDMTPGAFLDALLEFGKKHKPNERTKSA